MKKKKAETKETKQYDVLVICGEELVSLEVGTYVRVVATKLDPTNLKTIVTRLETTSVEAKRIVITSPIDDILNKDLKQRLMNLCNKMLVVEDSIDFTII